MTPHSAARAPSRRALLGLSAGLLAASALPACAFRPAPLPVSPVPPAGNWLQIDVQDRDSGVTLPLHAANGQWYVAGRPGARYGVTLHNLRRERLLVVMAVDGINVLTGQTAGWDQGGYVLGPLERAQIAGWRKSDREIAAFEFTALGDSYAARTGRPLDVGVIGIAVFQERRPPPPPRNVEAPYAPSPQSRMESPSPSLARPAPMPAPAVAASPPSMESGAQADRSADSRQRATPADSAESPSAGGSTLARRARPAEEAKLGTGHGAREPSVVGRTTFERARSTPDELIAVRYDSRANLVAQGIIASPEDRPPVRPRPFPRSPQPGFVPDPPAY